MPIPVLTLSSLHAGMFNIFVTGARYDNLKHRANKPRLIMTWASRLIALCDHLPPALACRIAHINLIARLKLLTLEMTRSGRMPVAMFLMHEPIKQAGLGRA